MSDYLKEACVENLMEAITAFANGADQLELCADLNQDGLTPHYDLVQDVVDAVDIPVKVMIRSRGGHFNYTIEEIKLMTDQLLALKELDVDGFVLGALTKGNKLDLQTITTLCQAAGDIPITLHKCIDEVTDYKSAILSLKKIPNLKWILTSGTKTTAADGKEILKEMITTAAPEIQIIPAGKILASNVESLHSFLGATVYHGRRVIE